MFYRCLDCGEEISFGWLPSATCGTKACVTVALGSGAAFWPVYFLWERLGWWTLLLAVPLFFVCVVLPEAVPEWIENRLVRKRPCPLCGGNRWIPQRGGFGL
jgi:hypothetical protein